MQLRIFTEAQQGATYDDLLRLATATEELGFDAFFRSDHYLRIGGGDPGPGSTDAWTTFAGLARETSRIRLGTLVTPATFRQPGSLAIQVAQVDQMSGGRVELGLGAGWYAGEHEAYGIPFPDTGERFDRLAEQLAVVTGLWDTKLGGAFSYDGRYYRVTDSPALPKPVQSPHPPILVGGKGPRRTPALAATYADEFNALFSSAGDVRRQYDRVRAACADAGREPDDLRYSVALTLVCGREGDELDRRMRAAGRTRADAGTGALVGTAAEVVEQLREYEQLGATRAYLQLPNPADPDNIAHIEYVASEVAPHLP